ncbi:galactokinase [Algoriphagus algorifonticola]|uniref:galactokinase n=1 Tax=Algoriphagus algorifonticola TaxID=2593007 RepID=UPI0011A1FE04|nr:galactokinase [Algoriphagus algorifonticola]
MFSSNFSQKAIQEFQNRYQKKPRVFRSPGRINVIGEHIDYNNGWVMPAGIDKEVTFCISNNETETFRIFSLNQQEEVSFTLSSYNSITSGWAKYVIGVIDELIKIGKKIPAFDATIDGNVPFGSGLSSSAALECATAFAINEYFELNLSRKEIALISQAAENNFVGVNCGIMDQFASVFSKENQVIKLDCDTLEYEYFPCDLGKYTLILANSLVKHSLGDSEYNTRRRECETALEVISDAKGVEKSFRNLTIEDLDTYSSLINETQAKRVSFVLGEISRVQLTSKALKNKDFHELGKLLYESHQGLQYLYEVSCEELDFMVSFSKGFEGLLGSRMMGGGFGGCTINLIERKSAQSFQKELTEAYFKQFGIEPEFYQVNIGEGSSEVIL